MSWFDVWVILVVACGVFLGNLAYEAVKAVIRWKR